MLSIPREMRQVINRRHVDHYELGYDYTRKYINSTNISTGENDYKGSTMRKICNVYRTTEASYVITGKTSYRLISRER